MLVHQHKINGFSVGITELPYLESVSIGIFIPVGSRHEDDFSDGIAHFTEHMIFKATSRYNTKELARKIEGIGCTSDAYTSEDQTALELFGPSNKVTDMLSICANMLWDSSFLPEDIESEASVIEEEIQGCIESPSEYIFELASQALWGNSPLGKPITGTVDSIKKINQQELLDFHKKFYTKSGIVISIAGNINASKTLKYIEQEFPQLHPGKPTVLTGTSALPNNFTHYSEIEQCHLCLSFPTFHNKSPKKAALQLLSIILGETMSSRLFQSIREEFGLCYSIESDYTLFEDTGVFQIYSALDLSRYTEAEERITLELKNMVLHPVTENEFSNAKNFAIAQRKISLEGSIAHMDWIAASLCTSGKVVSPTESLETLTNVTREQVIQVAEEILDFSKLSKASILPYSMKVKS